MNKLAGVGLTNILVIWLICCMFTVMAKTIVLKFNMPDSLQTFVTAV